MPPTASRTRYHHGDLRAALVDAALELIGERGVHGFTVVEAARRTGVSTSAPYRHFADRDELLAAVAARAYEELGGRLEEACAGFERPADRLAAAAAAYVRFAFERRAMFEALFGAGLEKARYPELSAAADRLLAVVWEPAARLAPGADEERTWHLVQAVTSVAHGHAVLLLDGALADHGIGAPHGGDGAAADGVGPSAEPDAAATLAIGEQRAAAATRALVRGRSMLFEDGGGSR